MRRYLQIDLNEKRVEAEEWTGESLVKAGRFLIAKTLVEQDLAAIDPLGPDNPLIFSAGPLAGTTFSNANRISVGCKSPLTGGVKEANGGGTFAYALGRLAIAGLTLLGQAESWVVIHLQRDGTISFDEADPYLGQGNYETAELLHERYGKRIAFALCGPVGEYQGLLAGIACSDNECRPSRLAARGGVGAVLGSKRVKAIVVDLHGAPQLHDRKATREAVRAYARKIQASTAVTEFFQPLGTMGMADYTNHIGGLPVNNFSRGRQVEDTEEHPFKMGGDYISDLNVARGGNHTHACMPGCVIQCSNIIVDETGQEVVSPVEYETLGMLGTNTGLTDPDDLARMNWYCNNLGIDTIETGVTIGLLMEAGLAAFGDRRFMEQVFAALRKGSEQGRLWAQGAARVGAHYRLQRVPVIKKQAISAYDPRVVEVTGISMMTTAQGADHTAGNVPRYASDGKELRELMEASLESQIATAAADSLGLCIFGRSATNPNVDFLADTINSALGTNLQPTFFQAIGRETLRLERQFNEAAGFTEKDDTLPRFFYEEAVPPTGKRARFHGADVHDIFELMDEVGLEGVPDEYGQATSS